MLLLVGGGGHCRACVDVIDMEGTFRIRGILDEQMEPGEMVFGSEVLGTDRDLPKLIKHSPYVLIAVGQIKSAALRKRLFEEARELGAILPSIASPLAHVSRYASIGEGSIAMHGAIVNAGAKIGVNGILNSQALVEHDAQVADHCHISTGARVNGGASIGEGTFIGSGAIIHEGVKIGKDCVIGAGVIVRKDQPAKANLRDSS